jgi:uncharacterized protein YacL
MEIIPEITQLTRIFSHAVAPAFFLGAVAAFVALMTTRLTVVSERIASMRAKAARKSASAAESARLDRMITRARMLSDGILLSLVSGICATLLLAELFISQFFNLSHAYGSAVMFIAATLLLGAALFRFAQETLSARRELEEEWVGPDNDETSG